MNPHEKTPSDNKKKTMVVAALGIAMLGIGAFQFVGGSAPAPAAKKKEEKKTPKPGDETDAAGKKPAKNPMYALALNARDPFQPAPFSLSEGKPALPLGSHPVAAEPVRAAAPPEPKTPSLPPPSLPPMGGALPPLNIPSGEVPSGAMPPGLPAPTGQKPIPSAPPDPVFDMTLVGVVEGARPLALFRAAGGGERLVPVGATLDGSTRLLSVGPRRARVRFHGRTLDVKLSEEPPPKAAPNKTPDPKTPPLKTAPQPQDAPNETPR